MKAESRIMNADLEARIRLKEAERSQTTTHNVLESTFVQLSVFSFQPLHFTGSPGVLIVI
jgi:hypothetical protein